MGPPALVEGDRRGTASWVQRRASHWERPRAAGPRSHRHLLCLLWGQLCGIRGRGRPGPLKSLSTSLEASVSWPAIRNNTHPSSACVLRGEGGFLDQSVEGAPGLRRHCGWEESRAWVEDAPGSLGATRLPQYLHVYPCVYMHVCTCVCNMSGRPAVGSSGREALWPPEQGGRWGGGSCGTWTSLRGRGRVGNGAPGLSSPEEGWARVFWKEPDRFTVRTEIRIAFHFHVSQNILLIFFPAICKCKNRSWLMDTNLEANTALCDFRWGPDHRFWEDRGHLNFAHCCLFTSNPVSGTQQVLSKHRSPDRFHRLGLWASPQAPFFRLPHG